MKNRLTLVLLAVISLINFSNAQQQTCYQNPSIEGPSQAHVVPAPWQACYGSPDTQPGQWGITQAPSNGNSYVSFLHAGNAPNGYSEGMTQLLSPPMIANTTYTFTVDLCHSNIYNTASPGNCYSSLAVWGGNSACARTQLLWTSGVIWNTAWQSYTITFTPTANWTYLSFEPYYITACSGYINVMMDNISCIVPQSTVTGTNVTCFGACNGTATATPTSGTPPFTYNWLPGNLTTQTITGLCPGSYTCTVTDATAQTSTGSYTVTQPTQISFVTNSTNILCNGQCTGVANATASGGTGVITYSWAPGGQTTTNVTGLCAGSYTVTATDANSCTRTTVITITQPNALTVSTTPTNPLCFGGTGSISSTPLGGTPGYQYSWSPSGGNGGTATGLLPGTYTLIVTDANNCTASSTATITQPAQLVLNTAGFSATCFNSCNGQAVVIPNGGTTPFSYLWTPGNITTASASALCANTYTIIVTDANGCSASDTAIVTQPSAMVLNANATPSNCGQNNGTATINVQGGNPGYTYVWAPSGGTGSSATGLNGGTYTITVTDANQCTMSTTVVVPSSPGVAATVPTFTDVTCFNACDGTADALPNGGSAPYTYLWSNASSSQNQTGLCPGTYTVTITDANNCSATATVTIAQPTQLSITASNATSICVGANASLSSLTNGGTPGYTYLWSNGGTASSINVSPSATTVYTVVVSDANGCTASSTTTVTVNALPVVAFTPNTFNGCAPVCVQFLNTTVNTSTCSWDFGDNSTSTNTSPFHCYPNSGAYTVALTVTDNNGCINTLTLPNMVNVYPVPTAGFLTTPATTSILDPFVTVMNLCTGCDSSYFFFSGDPNAYTGSLVNYQFGDTGVFMITQIVTTSNGCSDTLSRFITINPEFTFFVPNAFTPNGDGNNEIFLPIGTHFDPSTYKLYIFDRWGALIFTSTDHTIGWNGKANGGSQLAQEDVYVWKIYLTDNEDRKRQFVGHVSLIR
jgi:gliding motility-associated-like protein